MKKMNNKIANELIEYIANNLITESIFSTPYPTTSVEVIGLLDKIAQLRGIDKIENGKQFNTILDKIEKK